MFWEGSNEPIEEAKRQKIHLFPCTATGVMLKVKTFWDGPNDTLSSFGRYRGPVSPPLGSALALLC